MFNGGMFRMSRDGGPHRRTMSLPNILVAVATYNERENLPQLLSQIRQYVPLCDILVVDDQSPDGTGEWLAAEIAKQSGTSLPTNIGGSPNSSSAPDLSPPSSPRLFGIHRSGKLGLGTAVCEMIRFAQQHHYDFLVNMDADLSHSPADLPRLLETAIHSPVDVVIGSRYVAGGKIIGWPWSRRVSSAAVNWVARWLLKLPTYDNSGSMRCYRVATLEKIPLNSLRSTGYSFFEEILFRLRKIGATFTETPIVFTERQRGRSKVRFAEICRSLGTLLQLILRG